MVAAQSLPGAIPVKPDPGLIDDDLPVIIKPVVPKSVAESIPIRPDPVLDELLAPLQQSAATKEAAPPPVMPHVLPQLPAAETVAQTPPHSFSKKPLEAPDPLFQATQQNVLQHMASPQNPDSATPLSETNEEAGVKYNVFGIPIGPDSEPLVDDKTAPEVAEVANKAIVSEAAKSAARTHPGLPAGFTIPDPNPSLFTLPSISDNSLFKARPRLSAGSMSGLPPAASPQAPAPLVAPPPSADNENSSPSNMPAAPAASAIAEGASQIAESAAAPVKGKKGRKGKAVEAALPEPPASTSALADAKSEGVPTPAAPATPAAEPPFSPVPLAQPPVPSVQPQAPFSAQLPPQAPVDIVAAAAASAFGQLPAESISPLQSAVSAGENELDEEGFIIQTFVEPVNVVDPDRTMTLPVQQPPAPAAPAVNPWDSPLQPPPPPPTLPQPGMQLPPQQQPPPAAPSQKPLLQQWAAQAKDHADQTPVVGKPVAEPIASDPVPPVSAQSDQPMVSSESVAPAQPAAPQEPPAPPGPFDSHDHIVGGKYQTGAGEHHRGSWMEQGPPANVPNLGIPIPAGYDPDKPKDIGVPVRKGPQRPQISPLYQESFKSPVETPAVVPPPPESVPPAVSDGGVYNALSGNDSGPGMPAVPQVPDNIGKKGKNVAWGGIKGGLSRGQRSEETPQVYTDKHLEPQAELEAESAFPEVAAHPMLPTQTPVQASPVQQPIQQPMQSFAQGDDDAPHCPQCSARLEGGSNFCGECGHKLGIRIPTCVTCQAPLDPSARFCGECGTKVIDPAAGANPAPVASTSADPGPANQNAPQDPEKAMEDYLSGFGPNQKDKHWSNKLKKILD